MKKRTKILDFVIVVSFLLVGVKILNNKLYDKEANVKIYTEYINEMQKETTENITSYDQKSVRKEIEIFEDPRRYLADTALCDICGHSLDYVEYTNVETYGEEDGWSEKMITYLSDALQKGIIIQKLEEITAEYKIVSEERKKELSVPVIKTGSDENFGIAYYVSYLNESDVWYEVSLFEQEKEAVVICHEMGDGYNINFLFFHYGEDPIQSGGWRKSNPYFIEWDGINYMVVPYWNKKEDKIVGVAVYDYYSDGIGKVVGIGINSDGTMNIYKQAEYWTTYSTANAYHAEPHSTSPEVIGY